MGGKSGLLGLGLGEILLAECATSNRFVDAFAGSGAVARFVALNSDASVMATDLQLYSKFLAASVIERTEPVCSHSLLASWSKRLILQREESLRGAAIADSLTASEVVRQRNECMRDESGFITRHYGGHYFSREQANWLDYFYRRMPKAEPHATIAMAALLETVSACAAAPGHTAQPFQPTQTLLPYIATAWSRDVISTIVKAVERVSTLFAQRVGKAYVGSAELLAGSVQEGDLVFFDPPYSAVQYSRFYHVLEGIARGGWPEVSGAGRAPIRQLRQSSLFSMKSTAEFAMGTLLDAYRRRGCVVIMTFPDANASNGLSASSISALAARDWHVSTRLLAFSHSTLGGSRSAGRGGRRAVDEAVIVLRPR